MRHGRLRASLLNCVSASIGANLLPQNIDRDTQETKEGCQRSIRAERAIIPSSLDEVGDTVAGSEANKAPERADNN